MAAIGFPTPPVAPLPRGPVGQDEEDISVLDAVERLASQQRRRLEELAAGQQALEAAVRALRRGQADAAREVLMQARPSAAGAEVAMQRPPPERRVSFQPAMQRSDSAPALVAPKSSFDTPQRKKEFVPVWGTTPGGDDALTPPKLAVRDHIQGGSALGDAPGMHGHIKDADFQGGLERGMGHGRRYIGATDHFEGHGTAVGDGPGAHGNPKDLGRPLGKGHRHIFVDDHIQGGVGDDDSEIKVGQHGWLGAGKKHFEGKDQFIGHVALDQTPSNRRHYVGARDHWKLGTGVDTPPENEVQHGHARETSFENGLERYIGHGKRHRPDWIPLDRVFAGPYEEAAPSHERPSTGGPDHIRPGSGSMTCWEEDVSEPGKRHFGVIDHIQGGTSGDDPAGSHGQSKDDMFQDGLPRGIGHGKHRIAMKDHLRGPLASAKETPGAHGHCRDNDFQDGIERFVGHGKRHISSGMDVLLAEAEQLPQRPKSSPAWTAEKSDMPTAGMPSRYCAPPSPARFEKPRMW